ncbi:MAG TPA: 3'(2'),5'-bisphosphate nucleotidase [Cytophagales bacterium]|jgi:3'(2'), 5'-bisphosphate nucleotidase|nr:3'(2'),5'-bisphosphate nucleotidase [Cytophagales bacterium]
MQVDIRKLIQISRRAGVEILKIYNDQKKFNVVDFKADDSPLTLADQASHIVIDRELKSLYPDIPALSEEGKNINYEERKNWDLFWLVDPLDGTKEFIKRNGEFTVNIALIKNGFPIMGVIYAPALETTYYGVSLTKEAYKQVAKAPEQRIQVNNKSDDRIAVRSRSHASEKEEALLQQYNVTDNISKGSSLKFCMVAEGKADIYYRHGPTMEWDTAAGQAILEAAGGKVLRKEENERFYYNKENLLNPSFICLGF